MSPTIVDLTVSTPAVTGFTEEPREEEVLKSAIQLAQPERLRATLREICNSSPEAFRIARDLLLVPEEQVKHKTIDRRNRVDEDDEDEDEEDSSESSDSEDDSNISDDANGEEKAEDEGDDNKEHRPRVVSVAVVQTNGVKRLRSKFATCLNCSDEFDVTNNGKYSCVWHPGIFVLTSSETCLRADDFIGE